MTAPRYKLLPLAPIRRTFSDRVLAVGDAAGLVKATTGGGIYYSVVSARAAAETLAPALRQDTLGRETPSNREPLMNRASSLPSLL